MIGLSFALSHMLQELKVSSQYVSLICSPVDGQLEGVAGHTRVGSVLQKKLDTVQVPRSSCVVQDCVSIAGLGVHVTT